MSHDTSTPPAAPSGVRRREFLKVLGASTAAAATTACMPEKVGNLIPYLVSPEQTIPGVSTYFATTCRECAAACGLIAETRDGRITKLEGNPDHPVNHGGLCARGQSALQGLYNPDRLRTPLKRVGTAWTPITWDAAIAELKPLLAAEKGKSVFFNQHESGAFAAYLDGWLGGIGSRAHLSVDLDTDTATLDAHRAAYGAAMPRFAFSEAKLIVSFGADFLEGWGASVPQQVEFAEARAKIEGAPRFIYVGPRRSLTGLNADHWIGCKPGSELAIASFLRGQGSAADVAQVSGVTAGLLTALRAEVASVKPALFLSGVRGDAAGPMGAAVAALNQSGGAMGTAIRPGDGYTGFDGMASTGQVVAAIEALRRGESTVFMVRGVNLVHGLPKALQVPEAMAKAKVRIAFSLYPDETTELCDYVFPDHHALESWGDAEAMPGTRSLQQPAMDPVFKDTAHVGDVLYALDAGTIKAGELEKPVGQKFQHGVFGGWYHERHSAGKPAYAAALAKGFMPSSGGSGRVVAERPAGAGATASPTPAALTPDQFYLLPYSSATLGNGAGANKPWLLELPDPVTKMVWSSWVELHPETATRLGIERGDLLKITTPSGSVTAAAYPFLGVRPDVIAIPLGLGHEAAAPLDAFKPLHADTSVIQWGYGRYARNLGVNALDLLPSAGSFAIAATIEKTGDHEAMPTTEGSARQHGRGIAQALNVGALGAPAHAEHPQPPGAASTEFLPGLRAPVAADAQGELGSPTAANKGIEKGLYDPANPLGMTRRRWAMTIDLARCTGCSACVVACQAENNIPTVGAPWQNATVYAVEKAGFNITRGREMTWLRLERYYEGAPNAKFEEPFETRFVPMLCQHCGNAPCEPVCPVYATYHAPDGLNVQVYNRCVGTRYCSNNCPYKVRYFNWFGYGEVDRKQYAFPEPLNWQLNPDVTVRGKGVMEKCTFCVQRIREAENLVALEHRELEPNEFTTACAAACPSRAIVFGDAADDNWSVARLAHDRRAYHVFEELNTYTAVVYLKKVNHPAAGSTPTAGH